MDTVKIGLIGFGIIGAGVVKIIEEGRSLLRRRLGADLDIVRIADLDIKTDRGVAIDPARLTTRADDVLDNPDIQIVVELIGGYEPARTFLLKALKSGKHVVTANKALLAKHGDEIFAEAEKKHLSIGFEGSVGGAIPIIRSMREAFVANRFCAIEGIVNGTANYILSRMTDGHGDFPSALKEAQVKGYAEADPTFDIEGIDSAHKIAILTRLAYGTPITLESISVEGISHITPEDIECAHEFGYRIKLLAISKYDGESIDVRVHPAMIPESHPMSNVNGVLNAIRVCDNWMQESILVGHGAGSLPTGSAVVGDIVEISRAILSGARNRVPQQSFQPGEIRTIPIKKIDEIQSEYFLRFNVLDQPGVLSTIAGILGRHGISIESVIQRGRDQYGKGVPLVMMTHLANEKNVRDALKEIDPLDVICEKSILIRVEN
ncbi:MAG: homoserine dehydrogenase [Nitrospinae bacterium CG11_big_fil_rev_8_21_14_0_20_56_8]|nr:MAG: homoserine dehydrogenase [Nitrospinae bacterium CG11_big_fil_rev_8_21_14_0_20_56_8]